MSATVQINTRAFVAMTRELARRAKVTPDEALISEIGKVLEGAIRNTRSASKSRIRLRFKNAEFSMQPSNLYSPKGGRAGVKISKNGFIPYFMRNRYPDALWGAITARRDASFNAKIAAVGLAKKSWLSIARRLHLGVKAPAYVSKAVASTGKDYPENTATKIEKKTGKIQVTIYNSQPTANAIGGERALQQAVDGRTKGFLYALEKGTFDSLAKIAKKYPGIKIQ